MPLSGCGPPTCQCGIVSDSLDVSLSDGVFTIETLSFLTVTSVTRPASPVTWLHIFETDTGRFRVWDGANWVITGGSMPSVNLERQAAFSLVTATPTTVTLPTEIWDTDGFHTSTNGFFTVPAGYGGDYDIKYNLTYDINATGARSAAIIIASNPTPTPAQYGTHRDGGYTVANTSANGVGSARDVRLEAGATVTLQGFQTSGGNLDVLFGSLSATMTKHIPSLT